MTGGAGPFVSIIIPVFNRYEYTRRCLESVRALTFPHREVCVVDNASSDGTAELLSRDFPWVRVIRNPVNLGYAGGCNVGIRESSADYVLLLNNDTEILDPQLVDALVAILETDPNLAAVGPRIVDYHDHSVVVFDGGGDALGFLDISGVVLLIRRRALEQVGLFDEAFFAYYEDRDLFARLKEAGWTLKHVGSVRVAHKGSATAGLGSPFFHYWHNRNLLVLLRRHATLRHVAKVFPIWLSLTGWFLAEALRRRDSKALRAWLRGYRDGIRAALMDQPPHSDPMERLDSG